MGIKINDNNFKFVAVVLVFVFAAILFGTVGLRLFSGIFVLYFLPFYLFLRKLSLDSNESFFIALFVSFGVIPTLVYFLSKVFGSIRVSLLVIFLVMYIAIAVLYWQRIFVFYEKHVKNFFSEDESPTEKHKKKTTQSDADGETTDDDNDGHEHQSRVKKELNEKNMLDGGSKEKGDTEKNKAE